MDSYMINVLDNGQKVVKKYNVYGIHILYYELECDNFLACFDFRRRLARGIEGVVEGRGGGGQKLWLSVLF